MKKLSLILITSFLLVSCGKEELPASPSVSNGQPALEITAVEQNPVTSSGTR